MKRLVAYTWPDQPQLVEPLVNAIRMVQNEQPPVRQGDAVETLPSLLSDVAPSVSPCVVASWVLGHMGQDKTRQFLEILANFGRTQRPIACVIIDRGSSLAPSFPNFPSLLEAEDSHNGRLALIVADEAGLRLDVLAEVEPQGLFMRWIDPKTALRTTELSEPSRSTIGNALSADGR
jgi:hypothetical protein